MAKIETNNSQSSEMAVSTQIKHSTSNPIELSYSQQEIEHRIFTIRGTQVMLDRDLAELYRIKTIALNQAVKRNAARFPESFCFQLTPSETDKLITKCDSFKPLKMIALYTHTHTHSEGR